MFGGQMTVENVPAYLKQRVSKSSEVKWMMNYYPRYVFLYNMLIFSELHSIIRKISNIDKY
jgi:hypothetical protein